MVELNKGFLGYEVMYDRLSLANQDLRTKPKASEDEPCFFLTSGARADAAGTQASFQAPIVGLMLSFIDAN